MDVTNALKDVFKTEGGMDEDAAEDFLKELQRTRRFQMETWFFKTKT